MADVAELKRRKLVVDFIKTRIDGELHISRKKVTDAAGISESLLRRILREPDRFGITPKTADKLDRALQLEPGSIERMLRGKGDPIRKPGSPGAAAQAPDGAPTSMVDILRRWNRILTAEDAVLLADDLLTVYTSARMQGYDQGFEDGRAVLREAANGPASPTGSGEV